MGVDVENVSNGSAVEALWGVVERVPKTAPKGVVFCRPTAGTEI